MNSAKTGMMFERSRIVEDSPSTYTFKGRHYLEGDCEGYHMTGVLVRTIYVNIQETYSSGTNSM